MAKKKIVPAATDEIDPENPDAPVQEAGEDKGEEIVAAVGKELAKGKLKDPLDKRVAALEIRLKDTHNDLVEIGKVVSQMVGGAAAAKIRDILTRHAGYGR